MKVEEINDYLLTVAFEEAMKKFDSEEELPLSNRFRKKMNRVFREEVGVNYAYYPEVDNFYERIRSKIIRKYKVIRNKENEKTSTNL